MRQAEFPPSRVFVMCVVIDRKGFIDQHAPGLEGIDEKRKERPMQIEKDYDDVVGLMSEARVKRRRLLQVDGSGFDPGECFCSSGCSELGKDGFVAVDCIDVIPPGGEKEGVSASSCCHIQSFAFGETVQLFDQKRSRFRFDAAELLREPGAVDPDADGAGDLRDGRVQFTEPEIRPFDGKVCKQHGEESLRQGFQ